MSQKKIIAVVGATGAQGGGLVRAILADKSGDFAVRAITRDASSAKASALRAAGAEVVAGDVDDLESLTKAFTGAYAAYGVTFYFAHLNPERENADAENLARAAKAAGIQHFIWSTLEDTRKWIPLSDDRMPTLLGKYKVPHFDAKGEMDHVFTDLGVPTTFLLPSFYWENFFRNSGPKKDKDGTLTLTLALGNEKLAGIAAADIGATAYGIFKKGSEMIGQRIGVAGDQLTGDAMASSMSRALGRPVRFQEISPDVVRGLGFPGAEDVGNMFQFYRDFANVCNEMRDVARTKSLAPGLLNFNQWLQKNASKMVVE